MKMFRECAKCAQANMAVGLAAERIDVIGTFGKQQRKTGEKEDMIDQ